MKSPKLIAATLALLVLATMLASCAPAAATTQAPATEPPVTPTAEPLATPTLPPDVTPTETLMTAGVYSPFPSDQCGALAGALQTAIGAPVALSTVNFTDFVTKETGTACRLLSTGDGNTFGIAGPDSAVTNLMAAQGWIMDNAYGAGGATGMIYGYRKGTALAIVSVMWAPSADANCPKDQPIGACTLTAAQKLFTVTLDIAQKPAVSCTDQAQFVSETVLDDTSFQANATFTKTWRLKNTGTCTWTSAYAIVLASGDAMGAPSVVSLTGDVPPNQEVDLSVNFQAPATPGTYTSHWKLRNASGTLFGTGAANDTFYVKIVVPAPAAYSPYPPADCSTLGGALQTAIGASIQMSTVDFTDYRTNETGTACRLLATGDGNTFGVAGPLDKVMSTMQAGGWVVDNNYGAAGATGMSIGYRKGNALAIASVMWHPSSDANCPKDQPIGMCTLTLAQKLFEVKVDVVVK